MSIKQVGENNLARYYAVPGKSITTVRHGSHKERPFVCLRCVKNECEHIDAVKQHLESTAPPAAA